MNDLSLGRLRIANPDDSPPETPLQPLTSDDGFPVVPPLSSIHSTSQYDSRYGSHMSTQPSASFRDRDDEHTPVPSARTESEHLTFEQRKPASTQLQDLPLQYRDQQQAQFPSHSNNSRPTSMYYTHLPVSVNGNGLRRQVSSSRRQELDAPQRTSSRRTPQSEYRQHSGSTRSTPLRTASGNDDIDRVKPGPDVSSSSGGRNGILSQSPYNVEGGPLASSEEWKERGAATGIKREYDASGQPVLRSVKKGVNDFNFGNTLGEGSYSTVLKAQDRQSGRNYAIKVLDKRHIIKEKKVKYVNIEKETLNRLTDHPGVVKLYYTFQDEMSLYFVLDLCEGGELLGVLKKTGTFDEECTKFYGAQILDTIHYMHSQGVIHRDLKPENVLMDGNKHIKITDFGTAKMLKPISINNGRTYYMSDSSAGTDDRASSFVGTAEYVSPELLTDKNACKASDLWAFGCIIYQLLAGRPPFKAANEFLTFQKIVALEYEFPPQFPEVARDLVERLLVLNPQQRLSLEDAKNHAFFQGTRWGRGLWQQKAPQLKPFMPLARPPIKLNGSANDTNQILSSNHNAHSTMLPPASTSKSSKPRVFTELPPPSELDIAWSSVLTRENERILKLGNLNVGMGQGPASPDGGSKLARFFGGKTTKKQPRLVMVTSSARIIIAAAGGEEKKSKSEISLVGTGTEVMSSMDAKGSTHWTINTRDKHYTFEDIRQMSTEADTSAVSASEWMDAIERAKEFVKARAQSRNSPKDDDLSTSLSNQLEDQDTVDASSTSPGFASRGVLHKQSTMNDGEQSKSRKRFSKRQSKSGLQAVF